MHWLYNKSSKLENAQKINNVGTAPQWEIYLTTHDIDDINCLWGQSVLFHQMHVWTNWAHLSGGRDKLSIPFFCTFRDAALSVVSVNTDLIKCVMLLPLRLIFATLSWSLSAAHLHPGIPMRPTDWQQHKSQGCIKNTLGQRKELRLRLSDGEYLLWNELSAVVLMHHHHLSDNVVTYGLTECTPKHF